MAKIDYIRCDRCDDKIVYDGDWQIREALAKLGLDNAPTYCDGCRTRTAHAYSPDLMAMGDCRTCGRTQDDPIHKVK